jgi:hypothetical protein
LRFEELLQRCLFQNNDFPVRIISASADDGAADGA